MWHMENSITLANDFISSIDNDEERAKVII